MITERLNYNDLVNRQAPLNRGLIGWWLSLPQKNGSSRFLNIVNNKFPGVFTSGPTWSGISKPRGNKSIKFNGSAYVDIDPGPLSVANPAPFSVAVWAKIINTASRKGIIEVNSNLVTNATMIIEQNSDNQWRLYASDVYRSGGTVTTGWHHLVGTLDGNLSTSILRLYVDGILVIDSTPTGVPPGSPSRIRLGIHAFTSGFDGNCDDLRVYNRALSESEVKLLYNTSRTGYKRELNYFPTFYQSGYRPRVFPKQSPRMFASFIKPHERV